MPIKIEFRHDGGLVILGTGRVTLRDLQHSNEVIYHSSQRLRRMAYQLVDLSEMDSADLTEEDMQTLASEDVAAVGENPTMLIAVVLPAGQPSTLAELWQSGVAASGLKTAVFTNRADAEAWVTAQRTEAGSTLPPLLP
jgi:hypothetical protein